MAVTAEPFGLGQRRMALSRANHIRLRRGMLKQQVRRGRVRLVDVLADPPEEMLTCSIAEVLQWQERWGEVRATRLLRRLGISELRAVGWLTDRQRRLLIDAVRPGGGA